MRMLRLLLAAALLATHTAGAPAGGYTHAAGLEYAAGARHRLDVYVPGAAAAGLRPVVIFFYGGGWETGRRERYRYVASALTRQGFVAVIPDYRVYPEARFPDFVHDGAAAVRWTREHIARFGGDAGRIFLMGHSAGAHIAALLALDPQYLQRAGMTRAQLRGMIGLAGPYDFLPLESERLRLIFGPEPQQWRSQPIHFADGTNPPMLLITGSDDTTVPPRNTHSLAAKIRASGGAVTAIEYAGVGHAELLTGLNGSFFGEGKVLRAVKAFVQEH